MRKVGKPAFKPTKTQRDDVELLVATGMSEAGIAAAIGVCRDTLRKYFADELLHGHSRIRRETMQLLRKAAKSGNVAAIKALAAEAAVVPSEAPKLEPLGKKETLAREAQTVPADTEWGALLN